MSVVRGWLSVAGDQSPIALCYGLRTTGYRLLGINLLLQHADIRQVAITFVVIEAIADHKLVRDIEAQVTDRHIGDAALGLVEQRADSQAGRVAPLQLA